MEQQCVDNDRRVHLHRHGASAGDIDHLIERQAIGMM